MDKEETDKQIAILDRNIEELNLKIAMTKAENELIISQINEELALLKELEKLLNNN